MEFPPKLDIFPRLAKAARFVGAIITAPHQLATHDDHLFEHPLDTPITPVTELTGQQEFLATQAFERWLNHYEQDEIFDPHGNHEPWDVA